jgi:hypothetical protein
MCKWSVFSSSVQLPFSQRFPRILSEVIAPRKKDEALNRKYDYSAEPFRVRRSSTPFLKVASFLGFTKRRVVQRTKGSFHSFFQFCACSPSHSGCQFEVELAACKSLSHAEAYFVCFTSILSDASLLKQVFYEVLFAICCHHGGG